MAAKKKASAKKRKATTADPAVAVALEKWRATREPADADAVEAIAARGHGDFTLNKELASIARTSGGLPAVVERMTSVGDLDDDPRLTTAIVGWLHEARWPGSGAAPGWTAMFERLVALRDARAIAPLCAMARELPPFLGAKHRAWMTTEIARTANAIEQVAPPTTPVQSIALAPRGPTRDALSIVQRVFDSPDDDDVRRVVADELLEHGEPWGEFIQLQFAGEKKAADALVKKHVATFAGPLAKIAKSDSREFARGFLVRVLTNASMVPRPAWEAAATTPYWSTVSRIEIDMSTTPKWWLPELMKNPALRRLREVCFNLYYEPEISLSRDDASAPWRVVAAGNIPEPWLRFFRDFVTALPPEEQARIEVAPLPAPKRDILLEALEKARG